jgi:uracil-DNA glycosylase family 4
MATKLEKLSLDELYAKEKKTPAVRSAIIKLTDFSKINKNYCESICTLKCKNFESIRLQHDPVDILIIQDHRSPPGKYDRDDSKQEAIQSKVVQFICEQAGFNGLKFRLTNLLKCQASEEDFPMGKPPTQTTLQKCFPYLHEELVRSKPKVIISLGTAVTKSLGLNKHSNTGNRGEIAFSEYGPVVVTLPPRILTYIRQNARGSAGMWGPDYLKVIQRDFEKARKIAKGEIKYDKDTLQNTVKELAETRIRIAESIQDVKEITEFLTSLPSDQIISFDTETTSLDPLDPTLKILSIQFGWKGLDGIIYAGVIPLWHRENKFYNPEEAWKLVEPILLSDVPKVGHNAKYDILVIYWNRGIRVKNVTFDTLLLLHSIESGTQGCYGLKAACWDHLLDIGFAGYEESLGDLKKLQKEKNKEMEKKKEENEAEKALSEAFDGTN